MADHDEELPLALATLFERPGLTGFELPRALAAAYGGDLGFAAPRVFANFVASLDGVVTLREGGESGHVISGGSEADRFVMGLLRACADVVVIGAGTFRRAPGASWSAEAIYPPAAAHFAELRRRRGLAASAPLVLVSASGDLDPAQPALDGALVVTTPAGEARLRGRAPAATRLAIFDAPIRLAQVIDLLRGEGARLVLTEGGPTLVGQLVAERLLDELFVTSAPALFGRFTGDGRKSLIDGSDVAGTRLALASARRHGSHLFLRYTLKE